MAFVPGYTNERPSHQYRPTCGIRAKSFHQFPLAAPVARIHQWGLDEEDDRDDSERTEEKRGGSLC